MRSLEWILIPYDCCPFFKKKNILEIDTLTGRMLCEDED